MANECSTGFAFAENRYCPTVFCNTVFSSIACPDFVTDLTAWLGYFEDLGEFDSRRKCRLEFKDDDEEELHDSRPDEANPRASEETHNGAQELQ
jgi:hypothetical protein